MSHRYRWIVLLGLCALAGCGGGGGGSSSLGSASGGSSSSSSSSSSGASGSNVVALVVGPGPPAANGGTFNIPYTSVTLCNAGTTTCAVIADVLVDSGSSGLRIMASALQAAGLVLPNTVDPSNASNSIAECLPFADGYTWGPVTVADVRMNGELASSLSVNIIDDGGYYAATVPTSCTSILSSTSLNSVVAFEANGVLGVGVFDQDCGDSCAECGSVNIPCNSNSDIYYSCNTTTNSCAFTPVSLTAQVRNPVALFASDNNGVILELPGVPTTGQTGASGSLIFGIATQSNNSLGSATVLTADDGGDFITMFNGQTLDSSFIDSGSNGFFFADSSIPTCASTTQNPMADQFFCPTTPQTLQATNQGQNGATSTVQFEITSLSSLSDTFYASPSIGGPAGPSTPPGIDFGLPFFYGKNVYVAIEGQPAGSATGPYYAYIAN
jgi:hypothetical protein